MGRTNVDVSQRRKIKRKRIQVKMTKFKWGKGYLGYKPLPDSPMR